MDAFKSAQLPVGSPEGVEVRMACQVPVGMWISPLDRAMNPDSWRPTYNRVVTGEYAVFFHSKPSAGVPSQTTKFPHGMFVAWCQSRPTFPEPRGTRS